MKWKALAICCGYREGEYEFATWAEADAFRESYISGPAVHPNGYSAGKYDPGHKRAVVISLNDTLGWRMVEARNEQ